MKEIKVAVWNISGASSGVHSPASVRKINELQKNFSPDIAFYLEAPEGKCEFLPGVRSEKWETSFRVGADDGGPRGILVVKYEKRGEEIKIIPFVNPKAKTAIGIRVFDREKEFLRILGVWTTREDYEETLKGILRSFAPFLEKRDLPEAARSVVTAVVAGDTNVNLDSENVAAGKNTPDKCRNRREQWIDEIGKYGLSLLNRPGVFTYRKKNSKPLFQCDLLMASSEEKLQIHSLGTERLSGGSDPFERWGSDHLPLLFSLQYDA